MESLLAHLERKERERLRIRRVDVDASPELADRFRIEIVPTLVLVKGKRAVARLDGRTSAPRIEACSRATSRAGSQSRPRPERDGPRGAATAKPAAIPLPYLMSPRISPPGKTTVCTFT